MIAVAWLRFRRRHVDLEEGHGLELVVLLAATLYAFVLSFKGDLTLLDMAVLVWMFGFYIWRIAGSRRATPPGRPARLDRRPGADAASRRDGRTGARGGHHDPAGGQAVRQGLVATGLSLGIDKFLLVQWLAPLASEAPEFGSSRLFACAGQGHGGDGDAGLVEGQPVDAVGRRCCRWSTAWRWAGPTRSRSTPTSATKSC